MVVTCVAALLDKYRRSVKVDFKFEGLSGDVATALLGSFNNLKDCRSVWNVTVEKRTSDWKRNAGATALNRRNAIRPALGRPACIRSASSFPYLSVGKTNLYFFPDEILVVTRGSVTALTYADISVGSRAVRIPSKMARFRLTQQLSITRGAMLTRMAGRIGASTEIGNCRSVSTARWIFSQPAVSTPKSNTPTRLPASG